MIIWLASYPRSGNTFLRVILNSVFGIKTYSIYNDIYDIEPDKPTKDVVGHELLPENFDLSEFRQSSELFFIKTHECDDEFLESDDKVIYLQRDGRDSVTSYVKYINSYLDKKPTIDDAVRGHIRFGKWGDHILFWNSIENEKLIIKFEHLINEPMSTANDTAKFLGLNIKSTLIPNFVDLNAINKRFFKTGKVNSWKENMTNRHNTIFSARNHEAMLRSDHVSGIPKAVTDTDSEILSVMVDDHQYIEHTIRSTQNQSEKKIGEFKEVILTRMVGFENQLTRVEKNIARIEKNLINHDSSLTSLKNESNKNINALRNDMSKSIDLLKAEYSRSIEISDKEKKQLSDRLKFLESSWAFRFLHSVSNILRKLKI